MTVYKSSSIFPVSETSAQSFHLQRNNNTYNSSKDTISSSIVFKQRIDAMFSDTSSMISTSKTDIGCINNYCNDTKARRAYSLVDGKNTNEITYYCSKGKVKNNVQTQIEKMFADVETLSDVDKSLTDNFSFAVNYLGSLPLPVGVTKLEGLQKPLKDLYFRYKQNHRNTKNFKDSLSISTNGLKVMYYSSNKELAVQLNPFHTIAVWAAIKFVCRPRGLGHGKEFGLEYAFMPLIADSDSTDKVTLFQKVSSDEASYFCNESCDDHTPLFAVVMRKIGISRQLDCHGFICKTSDEAIVMAANLYKTLLNSIGNKQNGRKKKAQKNVSSIASRSNGSQSIDVETEFSRANVMRRNSIFYVSRRNKVPPVRPPRKSKPRANSLLSNTGSHYNFRNNQFEQSCDNQLNNYPRLARSKSMRQHSGLEGGDILTKIAIPHSRSFLNAGISSRYSRRPSGCPTGPNVLCRKNSLGSPLGLNELFNEFQLQEGLNNIEEILSAIVDSDGMSFNELKPIYKEFLLKLAVTLTKDEMYQRSKAIMQRQKSRKKELLRRSSCKLKKTFTAAGNLQKALRRSVSKLKSSRKKTNNITGIFFPSCRNNQSNRSTLRSVNRNLSNFPHKKSTIKTSSSIFSKDFSSLHGYSKTSDSTTENIHEIYLGSKRKETNRNYLKNSKFRLKHNIGISEEKLINKPSSEYFTCSECSHDSESCICICAGKCYCSIVKNRKRNQPSVNDVPLSSCSCDTDSCFESEKCYCNQQNHPSAFEQLKLQGFAASESSLSPANSPTTTWRKNKSKLKHEILDSKTGLQPTKSLEFLKIQRHPITVRKISNASSHYKSFDSEIVQYDEYSHRRSESISYQTQFEYQSSSSNTLSSKRRSSSSDNLAVDYNLFKHHNKTNNENEDRKVLVVSAHDPKGRVLYMGASCHNKSSSSSLSPRKNSDPDAISIKKSAEIASVFSSTRTSVSSGDNDVIYNTLEPPDYYLSKGSSSGSQYLKSVNLENSLGYFP